jgi:hypothetical protein
MALRQTISFARVVERGRIRHGQRSADIVGIVLERELVAVEETGDGDVLVILALARAGDFSSHSGRICMIGRFRCRRCCCEGSNFQ